MHHICGRKATPEKRHLAKRDNKIRGMISTPKTLEALGFILEKNKNTLEKHGNSLDNDGFHNPLNKMRLFPDEPWQVAPSILSAIQQNVRFEASAVWRLKGSLEEKMEWLR